MVYARVNNSKPLPVMVDGIVKIRQFCLDSPLTKPLLCRMKQHMGMDQYLLISFLVG